MEPGLAKGRSGPMPRTIGWSALVLLWVLPSPAAAQEDPVLASRAAFQMAVKAYQAHDVPAFLAHAREAERLRPDHGGVIYTLASACALSGDTAGAFAMLRRFAKLGYTADVAADSDFAQVRSLPAFDAVRRSLARNAEPVMRSQPAFTLPERDLLTEGIAYDPRTGAFFVGSVHHRKIVRVDRTGRVAEFVASARDGLWAPLGMRADSARGLLWVATAALPQMVGYDTADAGRSGLDAFDLATGAPRGRYLVPRDGSDHALGDVVITRGRDVYASDSRVRAALTSLVVKGQDFFRSAVIEAIGDYKGAYALPALIEVAKLDGPLQDDAVLAIGKIGDKKSLETLAGLQRTAPRAVQPSIAAAICLLGVNCSSHQGYLEQALNFSMENDGFRELLRASSSGLAALAIAGNAAAVTTLVDKGVPSRDPGRAAIALALGAVALRNTPVLLQVLQTQSDPKPAILLLGESFDMLEEDLEEERFYAAVRRGYWAAPAGAAVRQGGCRRSCRWSGGGVGRSGRARRPSRGWTARPCRLWWAAGRRAPSCGRRCGLWSARGP